MAGAVRTVGSTGLPDSDLYQSGSSVSPRSQPHRPLDVQNLALRRKRRSLDFELLRLASVDDQELADKGTISFRSFLPSFVQDLTHPRDTHLVSRKSSRLVGADHIGASESLDTWERTDDGILLRHLLGSESEAGGDDDGETFGNGSDSERDRDLKGRNKWSASILPLRQQQTGRTLK